MRLSSETINTAVSIRMDTVACKYVRGCVCVLGMRVEVQQQAPVVIALQQQYAQPLATQPVGSGPSSQPVIGSPPGASGHQTIKVAVVACFGRCIERLAYM